MDMREHGIEGYGGYNGYLAAGTHKILIVLKGNEYYYPRNITKTFTIKPAIFYEHNGVSDIWGTSSGKVEYGRGQDNVLLKIPKNAKGSMVVKVDGKVYKTVKQSNGIATVNLDKLPIGKHQIYAYYNGSDYSVIKLNRTIEVFGAFNAYKNNDVINFYDNAVYGNNNRYYGLKLPNDANGTLEVSIDGKIYTKKMVNGSAKIKVPSNLTVGKHSILIKYLSDDGYDIDSHKTSLYVYPKLISVSKMVLFGKNTVSFKASKDFKGTIYVKVSDDEVNTYKASFKNGIATVSLSKITSGKHKLIFRCNATGQIWKLGETTVTVAHGNNPKVIVAPKSIPYMNGAFKAKVVGVNGKPIKNANVVFKVNHKKVATAKTNALGIAMFKMAKLPGEYLLTAQYGKIAIHKHVEVVSMLKVKQVTVKNPPRALC